MGGKKSDSFKIDFDSYIRQGEPSKKEKSVAWATAIGLQQVDGLKPSAYLYETARRNIEGEISIEESKRLIDSYYQRKAVRVQDDDGAEEADKVSARIAELLGEQSFSFTLNQLLSIHERLFKGVFYRAKAGQFRGCNITKKEWALDGDTVLYANADLIRETLLYDFEAEKAFDYAPLSKEESVKHLSRFIANIWQVHPFGEGNTRTTAVFAIKYLRSLGFAVGNEPFEKHSWYFRNALVRANYTNMQKGVYMNTEFLERFFGNLLLGEHNELKNRYTHIRYSEQAQEGSEKKFGEKQKSSEKTSDSILLLLKENPRLSAKKLSESIGISSRAVEKQLARLVQKGLLRREGPPKGGHWELLE